MKELEKNEMKCSLLEFCQNQDDYGYMINIDDLYPDPNKDLEERVKRIYSFKLKRWGFLSRIIRQVIKSVLMDWLE